MKALQEVRWAGRCGERTERCQRQKKRSERVAAVKISSVRRKAAQKFWAPQQDHRLLWKRIMGCVGEGLCPSPTHSLLRNTAKKRDTRGCLFFCIRCESYLLYRALSAAAISAKIPACFLPTITRITSRVAIISTTAIIMQITTFCSRPAMMKLTKETAATVTP